MTSKPFPTVSDWTSKIYWKCQALSELGFIVVNIDGLGTPYHSKAFHDVSYDHMGDAGGIIDHVGGITRLAATRKFMDLSNVGIYGHFGGEFMTAQAMLTSPEFYKAGCCIGRKPDWQPAPCYRRHGRQCPSFDDHSADECAGECAGECEQEF